MEDDAVSQFTSEPPLIPVDRSSGAHARTDIVLEAFETYQQRLTSFAYGMTRDAEVADDLVQEAFLRLIREVDRGVVPDNISAWLYRVCSNLAISRARRSAIVARFARRTGPALTEPAAETETLRREMGESVQAALAGVPTDARAALLMAAQGFSGREIAQALGRTETATRTLMFRARERLRVVLTREGAYP